MPSPSPRLRDVFEHARNLPPDERPAYLDAACAGDGSLRAEVDGLLAAHDDAPDFLDRLAGRVLPDALGALPAGPAPDAAGDDDLGSELASRYEVLGTLGRGGMGVVYKARDRRLGRTVALKLLPPHRVGDAGSRARLEREARAASALDHPHVATIYEVGETAERGLYIAMAYVPGDTLADRIGRGPLAVEEAIRLAEQVAGGLAAAHAQGVIHRDLKPSNVLVTTEGEARVIDFGVAKTGGEPITRDGTQPGTVAYMSPEQTRGAEVDARSDIWALGAVLYEMLTGERPFRGASDEAVVVGIRRDEPPALARPDIPPALARVVARCLAKSPDDRFDSALDAAAALRAASRGRAADERVGLVVLPFANLSADPDDAFFGPGLAEEVIADLTHVRALRVISRTSSARLREHDGDVRSLARDLGVRYVLEGAVRRSQNALRISVRLVDARADDVVWARTFRGAAEDVFDLQEEVSRFTVEALKVQLSPREARALSARPIPDPRAFESFLRARYEAYRFSKEGIERAERAIGTALDLVGDNALLYSTLGHITAMSVDAGLASGETVLARVDGLADQVFDLDPTSARGHWLKAFAAFYRGHVHDAIAAGERALALAPEEPDALLLLGYVYVHVGRTAEAAALFDRALRLDPLTPLTQVMPGAAAAFEGRFTDAVPGYRRGYEMEPESPFGAYFYGWALALAERTDEAAGVLGAAARQFEGSPFGSLAEALGRAIQGDTEGAADAVTPALEAAGGGSGMFARELAHVYALVGKTDRALDWLERAVAFGLRNRDFLETHDRFLTGVRAEPRFQALLHRLATTDAPRL